jgi:hypothetical protein
MLTVNTNPLRIDRKFLNDEAATELGYIPVEEVPPPPVAGGFIQRTKFRFVFSGLWRRVN